MSHRSLRIQIDTNENLSDDQIAALTTKLDKYGHFLFLEDKLIQEEDLLNLPPLPAQEEKISLSQRQRNIIYRLWESKGKPNDDFQGFYVRTMTKLNEYLKEQIV